MRYKINYPHIVHDTIEDETILINLKNGNYYNIENSGTVLWDIIEKGGDVNDSCDLIAKKFKLAPEKIKNDIEIFISNLLMENLLVPLNEKDISSFEIKEMEVLINEKMKKYAAPVINKYSDMRDALMLDPIHEVDERGWPTMNEDLMFREEAENELNPDHSN